MCVCVCVCVCVKGRVKGVSAYINTLVPSGPFEVMITQMLPEQCLYQICASLPSSSVLSRFLGGREVSKVFLGRLN